MGKKSKISNSKRGKYHVDKAKNVITYTSPLKDVKIVYLTPPTSEPILTPDEINREPTLFELQKVREMFFQKDYINDLERDCLIGWHNRNMINSEYYRLNVLLQERKINTSFKPSDVDDSQMLNDYDCREFGYSPYHLLWMVQHYEGKFLQTLREDKKLLEA